MEINDLVANFSTNDENRFVNKRVSNIKSDVIEITEDKLENILLKHIKRMGTRKGWLTPLGLFITVVLANVPTSFSAKFGIPASIWESSFILAGIGFGGWLFVSLIRLGYYWKESSTDFLICKIKDSDKSQSS